MTIEEIFVLPLPSPVGLDHPQVVQAPVQRRSARIAGAETAEWLSMKAKAIKLRAFRDALTAAPLA